MYAYACVYIGGPYQHHELTNARIVKEKITFRETGTTKVYCFAPVINSTEWINKSVSVNVLGEIILNIIH